MSTKTRRVVLQWGDIVDKFRGKTLDKNTLKALEFVRFMRTWGSMPATEIRFIKGGGATILAHHSDMTIWAEFIDGTVYFGSEKAK